MLVVGLTSCGKQSEVSGVKEATKEGLAGTECVNYTGGGSNFHWSFSDTAFRIEAGTDPIPRELLDELVGEGRFAKKIEGSWRLEGMSLILSEVMADGQPTRREGRLVAATAGTIRVTLPVRSQEQFVFDQPGSHRK
jgi:hypothetical protein